MSENLHKIHLTSFQVIILGFAGVILSGALLLMLPWASVKGAVTPFHEALFTATFGSVCDRTGSTGYRKLLVFLWTGSHSSSDTDRRIWRGNGCCCSVHDVRKKNLTDAAQYHAECDLSSQGRGHCPSDKIHSERDISYRRNWSTSAVTGFLP